MMKLQMQTILTTFLIAIVPLATCQLTSNCFIVSSLNSTLPTNRTFNPTTFRFTLLDPSPTLNKSTTCGAQWYVNGSHPTSWTRCADASYAWYLSSFNNLSSFTLEAQYSFTDPSLGPPPFDGETQFARGRFEAANLSCWSRGYAMGCKLANGTNAQLDVYAIIS